MCRNGILPNQILGWNVRTQIQHLRPHIAVRQFEPCARKRIGKSRRIVMEAARDRAIDRIHFHRHIRRGHHRQMGDAGIMGIHHAVFGRTVHRVPLLRPRGAFAQGPVIFEQDLEIPHVPSGGIGLPSPFDPRPRGMGTHAGAKGILPTQTLLFKARSFGFTPHKGGVARAVCLAKGMPARHQGYGFFIIHRHACKGFANVAARCHRIGHAVRAFGVHVDQPHLHSGQRVFQLAVALIAFVAQPCVFVAPIDIFLGFPHIGAATAKAKGLQAHRVQRAIARQDHQIGPRNCIAVFLLDRPQQAARLIKVHVIWPRVQRRKPLRASSGPPAPVAGAVSSGRMPRHANEQRAVMAPISRPPILAIGHQRCKVSLQGRQVQLAEGLCIGKIRAHRVGLRRMLVQDFQVQLVRPPVFVGTGGKGGLAASAVHDGTFARGGGVGGHNALRILANLHLSRTASLPPKHEPKGLPKQQSARSGKIGSIKAQSRV